MNLTQVRAARPDELRAAANSFFKLAQALDWHEDRLTDKVLDPVRKSWHGTAGLTAASYIAILIGRWADPAARVREVADALDAFAAELTRAQGAAQTADRRAAAVGIGVGDDGLDIPDDAMLDPEVVAAAQLITSELGPALVAVTEADRACAAVFGRAPAGGSWWQDLYDKASWLSSAETITDSVNAGLPTPSLPDFPASNVISIVTSLQGGWTEFNRMRDPDQRRHGIGAWAQAFKTEFYGWSVATAIVPNPATAFEAAVSATAWGGLNLLETHWHSITEAWGSVEHGADVLWDRTWEAGSRTREEVSDAWGSLVDGGSDLVGSVGNVVGGVGDLFG